MPNKGGLTVPVFEVVFNGSGSITSFSREYDRDTYDALDNLYAVCIADNSGTNKRIIAGFFIKTSYTHDDDEFLDTLHGVVDSSDNLSDLLQPNSSFHPSRLRVLGNDHLTENEMLQVMVKQYLKYSRVGSA